MADTVTPKRRSEIMSNIRAKCPSGDFMSRMNRLSGAPS